MYIPVTLRAYSRSWTLYLSVSLLFLIINTIGIIMLHSVMTNGLLFLFIFLEMMLLAFVIYGIYMMGKLKSFNCPHCGNQIKVPLTNINKRIQCYLCYQSITITSEEKIKKYEDYLEFPRSPPAGTE